MIQIERYNGKYEKAWDYFVLNKSVNGTFLQTRNFLNYHPPGRFKDCSLMVMNSNNIWAVIPACEMTEDGEKHFISHKGSTYGGPIVGKPFYNAAHVEEFLCLLEEYWRKNEYQQVALKLTSNLLCSEDSDLLEYMLRLHGFESYTELNTYIDIGTFLTPIVSNFSKGKRQIIKYIDPHYTFRALKNDKDCMNFYNLLRLNLKKYEATPIHTLGEILDFKNNRLRENVQFYGVFSDEHQLAGGMVFDFYRQKTVHTQNLSADPNDKTSNAISFLFYSLIRHYKELGYRYVSWGISTEDHGRKLNFSLLRNKESYGSKYSVNHTFFKRLI